MKNKIPIAENKLYGNLKEITQVYKLNLLPEDNIDGKHYNTKLELAILLEKKGVIEGAYRSLRFTSYAQLMGFLSHYSRSMAIYAKETNMITPTNFNYRLNSILKTVEEAFREK